ncbi:MAG: 50S ribosomal protein L11 methyltransferase [Chloroflexota bacterium]
MNWLEVSLTVSGELAESVADVLSRYSPNGVMAEQGIRHLDDEDLGTPDGPITVRAYLPADEHLQETRRKVEEALHYLGMIQALPAPSFRSVPEQNWMEAWKQHYRPIPIGRRLLVVPAWIQSTDPRRIAIKINPGMAFGTGTHPSTQLCLEFIDGLVERLSTSQRAAVSTPEPDFIDVGCGSGILSIAALKLGARSALGVDIDATSLGNARDNAKANEIGTELVLGQGSVGEILDGRFGLRSAPLVAVNILAPVIARLFAEGLANTLEPGGSMILSGILATQAGDVEEAARREGLALVERRQMGDWVALAMAR